MNDQTQANLLVRFYAYVVLKFQSLVVADWRATLKTYSVWMFAIVIAAPDLYDQLMVLLPAIGVDLTSNSLIPQPFKDAMRLIGTFGLIFRFIRQSKQSIADVKAQLKAEKEAADAALANAKQLGSDPVQG